MRGLYILVDALRHEHAHRRPLSLPSPLTDEWAAVNRDHERASAPQPAKRVPGRGREITAGNGHFAIDSAPISGWVRDLVSRGTAGARPRVGRLSPLTRSSKCRPAGWKFMSVMRSRRRQGVRGMARLQPPA